MKNPNQNFGTLSVISWSTSQALNKKINSSSWLANIRKNDSFLFLFAHLLQRQLDFRTSGPTRALCCGSVDHSTMTGNNCTYLHPFTTCAGTILACPHGEVLTDEGEGFCA